MKLIKAVVIEYEDVSRIGAATLLSGTKKIQVCGLAKHGEEGIEIILKEKPDVVILNIDLPDIDGTELISIIKHEYESTKIVVMTANVNKDIISAAISNGADCYYCKSCAKEEKGERFIEAVLAAYCGESWIDSTVNHILVENFRTKDSYDLLNKFSDKEITILKLIAQGLKNDQVANKMYLSEGTVRSYLHAIFTKLGVKDKLNAVREGIHLKILDFADMQTDREVNKKAHTKVSTQVKSSRRTQKADKESGEGQKGWVA